MKDFSRLPNELQCEIFYHSLPTNSLSCFSRTESPLVLLSVCKSWRALTLSTAKLWSCLGVYIPGRLCLKDQQRIFTGIRLWLRLSKAYPLSVKLACGPSQQQQNPVVFDVLRLLLASDRRLRHIELSAPIEYLEPLLDVSAHDFQILSSFAIDTRSAWNAYKTLDIRAFDINWSQLTSLRIGSNPRQSISLDECLDILTESVSLSECVLDVKALFNANVHRDLERISLPTLSHLHLTLHDPEDQEGMEELTFGLVSFLDKLDLPMLKSLRIEWLLHSWAGNEVWKRCHAMFISFMKRSGPSLLSLHLSYLPVTGLHIAECLSMTPYLETVDLRFNAGDEKNDPISDNLLKALTYRSSETPLLPMAHTMNLQCSGKKCSPLAVMDLIDSRVAVRNLCFKEFSYSMTTYSKLRDETSSLCKWGDEATHVAFHYIFP
ncbi:hypothetical protein K435DRAFT_414616 [Dendrothele bispora CBS 962.96]|uniref:Uncharacterized protein n=1 Tax=Dendrothele bispora (strain CBS 962.96) TaxID=1314807 RepID=A0A4S8L5S4_DENBC|nr:hypothetical protein K435DRAFT_414616 [Dendrothele bispora CBS 962.96]